MIIIEALKESTKTLEIIFSIHSRIEKIRVNLC